MVVVPPTLPVRADATSFLVDVALLLVVGALVGAFIWRYLRERRLASLGIAAMTCGWLLLAMIDLGILPSKPDATRWVGVAAGLFLLSSVVRWELKELRENQKR